MNAFKIIGIYIMLYMANALWKVFYNIYLAEIGLTGAEIGTLNSIIQALIFIAVVIWGRYADRKGIRPTLRIGLLVTGVLMLILSFVADFWCLVVFLPVFAFFYHPLGALTDAMAMQYATVEKKYSYGSFRLWGSLGWAVAATVGGYLFTSLSLKLTFYIAAITYMLIVPLLSTRKKVRTYKANFKLVGLRDVISNKPLFYFMGILIFYGMVCSPMFYYLNLYFSELHASNTIIGLAYAIMALSEIPLFLLGNKLLKKIGVRPILLMAMGSIVIRYAVLGYYPHVGVALAVGLLQGVSFAFFLVAAVSIIEKLMPQGQHATAQSLIWGSYIGIGQTLGNLLIGFVLDSAGMVEVMQFSVYGGLACVIVSIIYLNRFRFERA
ncbi:putative 3-phenylpropionic acid transporter [Saccharicrinis fermentans DSM 9555 = JCM 21142]|uniref:Putative 3-phenylpropionic acid transporter n=2 Tax=Saccharicrinis fermentans TaxID=982 RepID=W7YA44_9BACT|nr:putative 3-phenylpropionic acid transporter [Saccharicrinis fermentans DSM 9555 = JCM 21142]